RSTMTPLITPGGSSQAPIWSPDGKHLAYRATRKGFRNLFWKTVDGLGDEEQLTSNENFQTPGSFSPDGKWLVFWESDPISRSDIWVMDMAGERKPIPLIKTRNSESNAHFSPDGRWIAYTSDETGRFEIYVTSFPGATSKTLVSTQGGNEPVW